MSDITLTGDDGSTIVLAPQETPDIILETRDIAAIEIGGALVGPVGPIGPQGIQGEAGPTGLQGEQGIQGIQGVKGDTGATGPIGPKGDTGDTGPQGPQGIQGVKGDTGATGAAGSAATIAVGTVTTGAAGSSVVINNSGTTAAAVFDFTIPKGDTGAAGAGTGDMLASVYDPTSKAADAFSQDNMADGTTNKNYTATEKTKLAGISGTNTGDETSTTIKSKLGITTLSGSNTGDQTITLTGDTTGSGTGSFATTNTKMNGVAYSGLATGILKNTTTTGVPSIAVAADFPTLNQNTTGNAATATVLQTARNINGVSFNGSANVTVPGLVWTVKTTSATATVNGGYICNGASLVIITLPSTFAVGDTIRVAGMGAGGWKVAQPASNNIKFGNTTTTTGTGGSLASVNVNDAVELLGTVANTTWTVISSIGNITVV